MAAIQSVGIVGAGTMGSGIAQIACLGGFETYLHDPVGDALATGERRLREALEKGAARGRWSADKAERAAGRLHLAATLEELEPCDLVVEAAPEDLSLKRDLFARLSEICGEETILATNTSSLPVGAMATAVPRPERVCGMHFFNPPALMKLVEVIAGLGTSEETMSSVMDAGERMGRTAIRAADGPGFLANRVARPFGLEALRLLGDRVSTVEQIDRICRVGGGFRMGPFELMDLVGIDVGFEVSKSFYEQSFHEPRWQPHPIQAQMAQSGRRGRKAGRGYYDYSAGSHRPDDPEPPEAHESVDPAGRSPAIALQGRSLSSHDGGVEAIGFRALGPIEQAALVELTRGARATDRQAQAAQAYFEALGKHVEWVEDSPGLVLARIVCQVINEAAFALQKGVGSAEDIDTAMRFGFNYPRGPLEWGDAIGVDDVLAVLDGLYEELHEERYRAAPLLRRMAAEGRGFRA